MGGKKKNHNHKPHAGKNYNNNHNNNNKKAEREMRGLHKRKRDRMKYGGERWCADNKKLNDQLAPLGLTIRDVAGDGNCLFRAIADQLEGNANKHDSYRQAIVTHMIASRDNFEPFLDADDDGSFEDYTSTMREHGTWGGNLEIQAASLLYKINIIIYQLDQPRWEVVNFADIKTKTIQLSYLDGDHYASVIPIDAATAPAPQTAIPAHITSPTVAKPKKDFIEPPNDFEKLVMENSGNKDINVVRKALEDHEWDGDATIAFLMTMTEMSNELNTVPSEGEVEGDQQVPSPTLSSSSSVSSSVSTTSPSEEISEEGHLHKKLSKLSKHIPHHPHIHHHGGESRKERRKARKNGGINNNNNTYKIQEPVTPQTAIKEMGALSI